MEIPNEEIHVAKKHAKITAFVVSNAGSKSKRIVK